VSSSRSYLLIDSRHGLKPSDVDMMVLLNRSFIPYQLIFTKSDLVKESDLVGNLKSAFGIMRQMKNASCLPLIHAVSSTTGSGIQSLQLALAEIYADTRYNSIYDGEDAPDASTPAVPAGGSTTVQQSPKPK
jgi:GTP-binding protein